MVANSTMGTRKRGTGFLDSKEHVTGKISKKLGGENGGVKRNDTLQRTQKLGACKWIQKLQHKVGI